MMELGNVVPRLICMFISMFIGIIKVYFENIRGFIFSIYLVHSSDQRSHFGNIKNFVFRVNENEKSLG